MINPSPMLEVLAQIRKSRGKRPGSSRERTAAALDDISDRLELIAGIVAVIAENQRPVYAVECQEAQGDEQHPDDG